MCTVVYYATKKTSYIVSLRDENTNRPEATMPQLYYQNNLSYISPKDGLAGGTWIGMNELGNVAVLLNGGFKNHEPNLTYTKSRGTIITSMLTSIKPLDYWDKNDFSKMAPCTIILLVNNKLFQLVWDGNEKHKIKLNPTQPAIWSSVTLYDEEAQLNRRNRFIEWLQKKQAFSKESILTFFRDSPNEQNGFIIKRPNHISTLSLSCIQVDKEEEGKLSYIDFYKNSESLVRISISKTNHDFKNESAKPI